MIRALIPAVLGFVLLAVSAAAQTPQVTVELEESETVVGQPLTLRIKILVPTWLPKPPVFPNIEMPSLMVRLPERASGPVSERIGGETWSGVQRAYRLYPLQAGRFVLPTGEIVISYAEPGKTEPLMVKVPLPEIAFTATVPPEAKNLSPLIMAETFELKQTIEGEDRLHAGDAVTRTVTASIGGTTPVMIPQLIPQAEVAGLRAYAKEPKVAETEDRGVLSGTRTEEVTYIAQTGGPATLPPISFDWFNLKSGTVQTAELPAYDLTVSGAPAPQAEPLDPIQIAAIIARLLLAAAVFWVFLRLAGPRIEASVSALRSAWDNSEIRACRQVLKAISSKNLSATMSTLEDWAGFFPNTGKSAANEIGTALGAIGAARFGAKETGETDRDWLVVRSTFIQVRKRLRREKNARGSNQVLPELNP